MTFRQIAAVTAFGIASVLANTSATAAPLSNCVTNADGNTQTCSLYETDANGNPSEVSQTFSNFLPDWIVGYFNIYDPAPVGVAPVLSDVVVFGPADNSTDPLVPSQFTDTVTLYSFDDGGAPPQGFPGFDSIGVLLGSATEDDTGFATFTECYNFNNCGTDQAGLTHPDTINVFSPVDAPEPVTLSLLGAGLVGAAALRRRRDRR